MSHVLLFALWFLFPAGLATLFPVLAAHAPVMKHWNAPMDVGKHYRGRRIFGDHKTWRGFFVGGLLGCVGFWAQTAVYMHNPGVREFCFIDYGATSALWIGVLLSFGAMIGDAGGSFFKRQFNVQSGANWFPWDQIDFIVGALLLSVLVVRLSIVQYLTIVLVWTIVHLIFGALGYLTKLKPSIL